MLTREEILSSYKKNQFPDKLLDEPFLTKNKNIIFYDKSSTPSSEKTKNSKKLSESYVIPRHLLIQKNLQTNQGHKNEFNRSSNFTPKEPLIEIQIDNFQLIYDKFSIPLETNLIYIKNTYGGVNGPYNLEQIKNLYKNKKIDSNNDFRIIDIFRFKDSELHSFQPLKIINDEKWIDLVIDNSLINYCDLFKQKKEEEKKIIEEKKDTIEEMHKEENKDLEKKKVIEESEGKWEVTGKKKKKIKSKEIKEKEVNEVKEEKKINKNVEDKDSLERLDNKINKEKQDNSEELLEILKKKKKEKEKIKQKEVEQKEEENIKKEDVKENVIKEVRSKKGKKKKKSQFEETEIDVGFLVK